MIKYPSIGQFREVIRTIRTRHDYQGNDEKRSPIYEHKLDYPKLMFEGTIKLHGTNAAVVKYKDKIEYQSRERVLSLDNDNAGFMLAMNNIQLDSLFKDINFDDYIAIFGEWCGSNIQSGVALSQLKKMFVIFGFKIDNKWINLNNILNKISLLNSDSIYSIKQFPTFEVEIDFNNPELIQNKLIKLTEEVEKCCPVAHQLGVDGIGEGIVFTSIDYPEFKFKSKGEKHSISKVKVLNSVNEEEINNIQAFIEYSCTDNRLNQGLSYLKENNLNLDLKSTGEFLRWLYNDILKEEQDIIIKNQINLNKANKLIASKAKLWFFKHI